jgi:hypothetical protein
MITVEPTSILLAGFRETGKTTFLVALWHTVANEGVEGALVLDKFYEGDRDYIIARHNEWLVYEPVMRTLVDQAAPIRMTLREPSTGRILQLGIPDLSGETFRIQFEDRRANQALVGAVRSASGIAIFINPLTVVDPGRIRDVWDALGEVPQASDLLPSADRSTIRATEFHASSSCTQVKYVDLLQQLIAHEPETPIRCAVIVSAMDVLDGTEFEDQPERFLAKRVSLLDQFLRARTDLISARIYGLSAQGGDYKPQSIESLAKLGVRRIRVCARGERKHDITVPLRWLAYGEV